VHYFEINQSIYDDVLDDDMDVILIVEFVDDEDRKKADINVNDHLYRINQFDKEFRRNINGWVEKGSNFVKITPKTTMDVVEIKVLLEE